MENIDRYRTIFCRVFDVPESVLNERFTFKEAPQWDSVAHLSLISDLEEEFDVLFNSDDILHYGSYLNGIEILKKYGIDL